MSSCRACGDAIVWKRTAATGRMIPLDATPNDAGNVVIDDQDHAVVLGAGGTVPLELAHLADRPRYMPHHATCEDWQ